MKLTTLARKVTKIEAGKKQVNIAQTLEILNRINLITKGAFYAIIRLMPERKK